MSSWSLVFHSCAALVLLPALALAAPAARPVKQYTLEQFPPCLRAVGATFPGACLQHRDRRAAHPLWE